MNGYDALLLVSFGGPDGPDDVMPFLENVTRGRNVPRERLEEVAEHYHHFGGKSPINEQNRSLIEALKQELAEHGLDLPIYFGNRNWHPLLPETLGEMAGAGVRKALAFFTSAYSSYSGCRQYRENLEKAQAAVGEAAPQIDKLRVFYNHPGFVEPMADGLRAALQRLPEAEVLFCAHSIPSAMAATCRYVQQLEEASGLVAEVAGATKWRLVYQSRSGSPHVPWLEPDVCDVMRGLSGGVILVPIGFISDHMEVLYDLDTECVELAQELGLKLERTPTVGTDPRFVAMIRELIEERLGLREERRALGTHGPCHDVCPPNCCLVSR